jgi:hypothetical protein
MSGCHRHSPNLSLSNLNAKRTASTYIYTFGEESISSMTSTNITCQRYETFILQPPQIHSLPAIRVYPPKRLTLISIMQIHAPLAAALALSGTAFASPTKQQDDAAAVSSRNYFGSKNAPYATMRPRSDENWDDIVQVVCADPCCGEAEQEDGRRAIIVLSPDTFGNSRYPRTYPCLPSRIYTRTIVYSYKNLCRARPIRSAAVGTFTNDSEGRANCLEMVTLLAGESGPDARAEKASAAPAKPHSGSGTKHPANRQPAPPPLFA